jgi:hypothetical protein
MTSKVTTIRIAGKTLSKFYETLIRLYGCTRGHVSDSIVEALELWIKTKDKTLEI